MTQAQELRVQKRMRLLGITADDIDQRFIRSSGPGGQNINKVATCVFVRHKKTGISVKCQQARSQAINRLRALERLCDKIEQAREHARQQQLQRKAKARRQNRKRSRKTKEAILQHKRRRSEKKKDRRPIRMSKMSDYL